MLKQVSLAHFEPVVTCFGPWKSQNALKRGRFGTKSGSKMGQKSVFPKVIWTIGDARITFFKPILSPFDGFWPMETPYSLKRGRFGSKNG